MTDDAPGSATPRSRRDQLVIGTFIEGIASGHWRDPRFPANGNSNIGSFREFLEIAERGKLDFGFIADTSYVTPQTAWHILSRLEPVTALSALAATTRHIGLVGTVTTSFTQPYDVARQFASLDLISSGRAGWNVVTSYLAEHAANYGGGTLPDKSERYRIATEYVEVVKSLWRSWEHDAFPRDRESGVYVDWSKSHPPNHNGKYFEVRGPLNVERSPQGEPVIFQAGSSPEGVAFGAANADVTFVTSPASLAEGQSRYQEWKTAVIGAGRAPDDLIVVQRFKPTVAETDDAAWAHFEERARYADLGHALGIIARYFQYFDFSTIDVHQPFPSDFLEHAGAGHTTWAAELIADADKNGLTIAEAALRHAQPDRDFVGNPDAIADKIAQWHDADAFDGLMLSLDKAGLARFVDLVIPRLQGRGLFRTDYDEQSTLRGNLGLLLPAF